MKERARLNLQVPYVSSSRHAVDILHIHSSQKNRINFSISPVFKPHFQYLIPVLTGFRTKVGACIECRVLRDGASQSGDGDSQGRGARARGEPFANEEHKLRDAVDGRRSGFQNMQGCS